MKISSKYRLKILNDFRLNFNKTFLRIVGYLQISLLFSLFMNCSPFLYTNEAINNNSSESNNFTSCGNAIEYITDSYRTLDTTFPVQNKIAYSFVHKKLSQIEDYFRKNTKMGLVLKKT